MSKELIQRSKQRSYSFHELGSHDNKQKSYHAEKSKNKIFQKGQAMSKPHKKFNPYKQKRENWVQRKIKREMNKGNQPPTPHNTTQFIVDAVYYPTDPYIYDFDSNKLEYDFQHHAMAGSMMDLMQQRLNTDGHEKMSVEDEGDNSSFYMPKLRTVKSADDGIYEAYDSDISDHRSYDQFLNEAKNGKNLENVIKLLVGEIRKKDDQINSLLFDSNKQAFLQES